jgi:ligand-binding sensor domain-containing protein
MMRVAVLLFGLVISHPALAQFPYTRTIDVRMGQVRPAITCMEQDLQGAIWVGSDRGLLRTDGDRVDVMLRTAPARIDALARRGGDVLAALSSGVLVRCDALGCDTVHSDTSLVRTPVRAMEVGADGIIHLATYGGGVMRSGDDGWTRLGAADGLPDDHVNDLAILTDGSYVAATDQGLALCRNDKVLKVVDQNSGAPDNLVLTVSLSPAGVVWAGTEGAGAFGWDMALDRISQRFTVDRNDGPVVSILAGAHRIWLGMASGGPEVVDGPGGGRYRISALAGSGEGRVHDLLEDREGVIWWCDGSDRLFRSDPRVLHVPDHEGLDLRGITALASDRMGRIWFATPAGLFHHPNAFTDAARATRVPVTLPPSTPIVSLSVADDGSMWAGSFGGGLLQVRPNGDVERISAPIDPNILSVRVQGSTVWLGTLSGIAAYHLLGETDRMSQGPGFVYQVVPRPDGSVLGAADGHGVVRLKNGQVAELASTGPRTFYSLAELKDGELWAVGPGTGLCQLVGNDWKCSGPGDVPLEGEPFALVPFLDHLLIVGSMGGLALDPATASWTDLTSTLGLQDVQGELNAVTIDPTGALWVACNKGLVRILPDPQLFRGSPKVEMVDVRLGNTLFLPNSAFTAEHDQSTLTVRFMAPFYADPSAVQFEYRLLGLSERPVRTREHEVSFAMLPPGDYTFQVRAFLLEGEQPAEWRSFRIQVSPPWWRRPWIIAGMVALALAIIVLLVAARDRRLRYRQRMEQEQVRFQLEALRSQVDPHFLFNSFNTLVELIETEPERAVEHVDQLSTFFRNILQVRDRDLITLSEELELLQNYFGLEQRRFGAAISLVVDVPRDLGLHRVVPLTLQLLVENAIKHNTATPSAPLVIQVTTETDHLVVRNALRAKVSPPRSTGFGLESIQKRYAVFSPHPVVIERTDASFVARIPLIPPAP